MSETDAAAVAVASGAGCAPALPEDVVADILVRVPDVAFLFRCAVVCNRWRRVVADPGFLRRLLPEDGDPPSSGSSSSTTSPEYTRGGHSRAARWLSSRRRARPSFLTSFVHDDTGVLDKANPMALRNGLLLLRVPRPAGRKVLRLCVCNLLTGKVDVLPALDAACFDGEGVRGCAVLMAADHGAGPHRPADCYSTFFQDDHLVIWTRKDGDQGGTMVWPLTRVIPVDVEVETPSFGMMVLTTISVGEKSGTALVLYPSEPDDAHVLDLQSGLTTKVVGWKRSFNYMTAVPYEINWPEFFMSRLGIRR